MADLIGKQLGNYEIQMVIGKGAGVRRSRN